MIVDRGEGRGGPSIRSAKSTTQDCLLITSTYAVIAENTIQSVAELQQFAHAEAKSGRPAVAEFATTRHGVRLRQILDSVLNVLEAPQRALAANMSHMPCAPSISPLATCRNYHTSYTAPIPAPVRYRKFPHNLHSLQFF